MQNPSNRISIWIVYLLVLFALLNVLLFVVYHNTHRADATWNQLWGYFESDVFKVVTASLALPIILLLLESFLNLRGAIHERLVAEKQARREKRLECIELTAKMWNELYAIVSEIRYFSIDREDRDFAIRDILLKLQNISSSAEDTVSMWRFRFPNLTDHDMGVLLEPMNVLGNCAGTVADSIKLGIDKEEIQVLQHCLGEVQQCLKTIAHHSYLSVLELSVDYLDEDIHKVEKQEIASTIGEKLLWLEHWAHHLTDMEWEHNVILSDVEGEEAESFRQKHTEIGDWLRSNPDKSLREHPEFDEFEKAFFRIPSIHCCMIESTYTEEYVKHLANQLAFEGICVDLEELGEAAACDLASKVQGNLS
ncbi:hypothetical protein ACFLU3_01715 [Chloroflexota bacterium]